MNPLKIGITSAAILVCTALSSPAEPVIFNVDPDQSMLTLSGAAFGLPFSEQAGHAGSLTDRWTGTIVADLSGGVLTFNSGSSITALLNAPALPPFSTVPHSDVPAGSIDNYGVFASGLVNGLNAELNGAYRTLTLDIPTGTATPGSAPSGMTFRFTSGHLEWGAVLPPSTPLADGSSSLINVTGANTSTDIVSLTPGGVLTIPVQFTTTGDNRTEQWSGTIVAVVPEPGTITLLLLGIAALFLRAARGRRH
jgi:hypothetical protein